MFKTRQYFRVLTLALQDERLDQLLKGQLNPRFSKVAAHRNQASKCLEALVPGVPPHAFLLAWVGPRTVILKSSLSGFNLHQKLTIVNSDSGQIQKDVL